MTAAPQTSTGATLLGLLPGVYRTRDTGDLARLLDAYGGLLDAVRTTLDQRLADCFPDLPSGGRPCQDWVVPYLGDLFGVAAVSASPDGRRREVAHAVRWRQRGGTLRCCEEIAQAVGGAEAEVGEGWRRVAMTPWVGRPVPPAVGYGVDDSEYPAPTGPAGAARHPGLPAVTVDIRLPARAVVTTAGNPAARTSRFAGTDVVWRQTGHHGVPCFPGSFDDPSPRVVDMGTPAGRHGAYHPRRVLVFLPPPTGFFPPDQVELAWTDASSHPQHVQVARGDDGVLRLRNPANPAAVPGGPVAVTLTLPASGLDLGTLDPATPDDDRRYAVDGLNLAGPVSLSAGTLVLRGCAVSSVTVSGGPGGSGDLVVDARDCLLGSLRVDRPGVVRLEHCTVLGALTAARLNASDCILGPVQVAEPAASCVRFSSVPPGTPAGLRTVTTTTDRAAFLPAPPCPPGLVTLDAARRTGALHPATPRSVTGGAEDGGELGACHALGHCLARAALLDKLLDHLPMGIEPVLVLDPRLLVPPPRKVSP
jgi:hypothetical protein